LGPYEILKHHSDVAYKLKLPPTMKIHPVINICKLTAFTDDNIEGCKQKHPGPVVIEPEGDRYKIVCIVNSQCRNRLLEYKLEWSGYNLGEDPWQSADGLSDAEHLIEEFNTAHPTAAGPALKDTGPPKKPARKPAHKKVT
jgi:hypothetical protein